MRVTGPYSNFLIMSLSDFGIRAILATKNELGSVPSSSILWMCLCRIDVSSLNVWYNSPVKPSASRSFYFGGWRVGAGQTFLATNSASLIDIKVLTLSIFW